MVPGIGTHVERYQAGGWGQRPQRVGRAAAAGAEAGVPGRAIVKLTSGSDGAMPSTCPRALQVEAKFGSSRSQSCSHWRSVLRPCRTAPTVSRTQKHPEGALGSLSCYSLQMVTERKKPLMTPLPTDAEAIERYALLDRVVRESTGAINELESALGMYVIGHHFGWRVLYLIHSKRTVKKYEEFLKIKVSEAFPEYGPDADRTNAYKISRAVSNFWKAVSGEEKPPFEIDKRGLTEKGT